jgi:hypothetical protein
MSHENFKLHEHQDISLFFLSMIKKNNFIIVMNSKLIGVA